MFKRCLVGSQLLPEASNYEEISKAMAQLYERLYWNSHYCVQQDYHIGKQWIRLQVDSNIQAWTWSPPCFILNFMQDLIVLTQDHWNFTCLNGLAILTLLFIFIPLDFETVLLTPWLRRQPKVGEEGKKMCSYFGACWPINMKIHWGPWNLLSSTWLIFGERKNKWTVSHLISFLFTVLVKIYKCDFWRSSLAIWCWELHRAANIAPVNWTKCWEILSMTWWIVDRLIIGYTTIVYWQNTYVVSTIESQSKLLIILDLQTRTRVKWYFGNLQI